MLKELVIEKNIPELKTRDEMLEILLTEEYGFLPPKPDQISFDIKDNYITERECSH